MFGYLVLTHPIGMDGQFIKHAHPVFSEMVRRIAGGESFGFSGLLSSQPTKASSGSREYSGRSELPFHVEMVEQLDLVSKWADDELGTLPGAFACATNRFQSGEHGEFQGKSRAAVIVNGDNAAELAEIIDQHTIDPLSTQPTLSSRLQPALGRSDTGGGMCGVLAPSSLLLNPGHYSVKPCVFVVWIAGSLFLLWHTNPMLVVDVVNTLNGDRKILPHVSNTIGYSQLALMGTLHINYNLYLKHTIRDMSRAGPHVTRLSTIIARTIYRLHKGVQQ